jgi:hypothetical protein
MTTYIHMTTRFPSKWVESHIKSAQAAIAVAVWILEDWRFEPEVDVCK